MTSFCTRTDDRRCDPDCEIGPVHCRNWHRPKHKPDWHDPAACDQHWHLEPVAAAASVTEHATLLKSGDHVVRNGAAYIEDVHPLAQWIENTQRSGGTVYRRRIIVVEDWTEVTDGDQAEG